MVSMAPYTGTDILTNSLSCWCFRCSGEGFQKIQPSHLWTHHYCHWWIGFPDQRTVSTLQSHWTQKWQEPIQITIAPGDSVPFKCSLLCPFHLVLQLSTSLWQVWWHSYRSDRWYRLPTSCLIMEGIDTESCYWRIDFLVIHKSLAFHNTFMSTSGFLSDITPLTYRNQKSQPLYVSLTICIRTETSPFVG